MEITKEIKEILNDIISLVSPKKVYVYGAKYTVNNSRVKSVDFCVIINDDKIDTGEVEKKLYLGIDSDLLFNVLVFKESDFNELLSDSFTFASRIMAKGYLAYEQK